MFFSLSSLAIVLTYIWVLEPLAPRWARPAPVVAVLALAAWRAFKTGEWGLRARAFLPALGWAAAFTAAAASVVLLAGATVGALAHAPNLGDLVLSLPILLGWAFGQQFALQTMLLRESQQSLGRRAGLVLAPLMFAALHLPNPFLAAATALAAFAWCWIYDRHPNLAPLALSHALLTVAVLYALNDAVTLRVGAAFGN